MVHRSFVCTSSKMSTKTWSYIYIPESARVKYHKLPLFPPHCKLKKTFQLGSNQCLGDLYSYWAQNSLVKGNKNCPLIINTVEVNALFACDVTARLLWRERSHSLGLIWTDAWSLIRGDTLTWVCYLGSHATWLPGLTSAYSNCNLLDTPRNTSVEVWLLSDTAEAIICGLPATSPNSR